MASTPSSIALPLAVLGALLCAAPAPPQPVSVPRSQVTAPFDGTLSVLTYNVEGQDWPLARDRPANLARIAARLRSLRRAGRQPHIVALQEAFSPNARAIARDTGYAFVVEGPSAASATEGPTSPADRRFVASKGWRDGEGLGPFAGSGLMVLSDFPILRVRRMAFPDFACAGFDCLAAKGALLVTLAIPGTPSPLDFVTTHLNSRHSSRVGDERSLYAYRRQVALLSAFVGRWHDPARPLIAAGDFNAGSAPLRWAALRAGVGGWRGATRYRDALPSLLASRPDAAGAKSPDVAAILHRATDLQLFGSGTDADLAPLAIEVPFGPQAAGMFSDHIGYVVRFSLAPRVRPTLAGASGRF